MMAIMLSTSLFSSTGSMRYTLHRTRGSYAPLLASSYASPAPRSHTFTRSVMTNSFSSAFWNTRS